MLFGEYLINLRLQYDITLREVARKTKIDVGYLSKIERGVLNPPQDNKIINKIAKAIRITSEEKSKLIDYASLDNSMFPKDVDKTLKQIPALPILLRTIANKSLTKEELEELINRIQKEY